LSYHALGKKNESQAALAQLINDYGATAGFQVAYMPFEGKQMKPSSGWRVRGRNATVPSSVSKEILF
jgi:hypothetical protein